MKESNYWEQFLRSGKIEDYLFFKENEMIPEDTRGRAGDRPYAGFCDRDGDNTESGAYRGI